MIGPFAIGALALLLLRKKRSRRRSAGSGSWSKTSRVQLSAALERWLDDLARLVNFPLLVTSGVRTPADQARALAQKVREGATAEDLVELYTDDLIEPLLADLFAAGGPDELALEAAIEDQVSRGLYLSRHLRGDALDLDVRGSGLTNAQINQVVDAVRKLGADPLVETNPPHIHIEEIL